MNEVVTVGYGPGLAKYIKRNIVKRDQIKVCFIISNQFIYSIGRDQGQLIFEAKINKPLIIYTKYYLCLFKFKISIAKKCNIALQLCKYII